MFVKCDQMRQWFPTTAPRVRLTVNKSTRASSFGTRSTHQHVPCQWAYFVITCRNTHTRTQADSHAYGAWPVSPPVRLVTSLNLIVPILQQIAPAACFRTVQTAHYARQAVLPQFHEAFTGTWPWRHLVLWPIYCFINPFNASCSKLLLFEGSSAILV